MSTLLSQCPLYRLLRRPGYPLGTRQPLHRGPCRRVHRSRADARRPDHRRVRHGSLSGSRTPITTSTRSSGCPRSSGWNSSPGSRPSTSLEDLDEEVVYHSSLTGMAEMLKTGCTTCFDHHYVFPAHAGATGGRPIPGRRYAGMCSSASRGSMDLSQKDGGLPPDSVVQSIDAIMADSERLVRAWHDASRFSMHQVARLLFPLLGDRRSHAGERQAACLLGVRLHTHVAETKDEERYTRALRHAPGGLIRRAGPTVRRAGTPTASTSYYDAAHPGRDRHRRGPLPRLQHEALLRRVPGARHAPAPRSGGTGP